MPHRGRGASASFHCALALRWTAQGVAAQLQRYTTMTCRWAARLLVSVLLLNVALAIGDETIGNTALRKLVAARHNVEIARQGKLVAPFFPTLTYVHLDELRGLSREALVRSLGEGIACPYAREQFTCLLWPMSYSPPLYDGSEQGLVAELDSTEQCVNAFVVRAP